MLQSWLVCLDGWVFGSCISESSCGSLYTDLQIMISLSKVRSKDHILLIVRTTVHIYEENVYIYIVGYQTNQQQLMYILIYKVTDDVDVISLENKFNQKKHIVTMKYKCIYIYIYNTKFQTQTLIDIIIYIMFNTQINMRSYYI